MQGLLATIAAVLGAWLAMPWVLQCVLSCRTVAVRARALPQPLISSGGAFRLLFVGWREMHAVWKVLLVESCSLPGLSAPALSGAAMGLSNESVLHSWEPSRVFCTGSRVGC